MNKIKKFFIKNKNKIVNVACIAIVGIIAYKVKPPIVIDSNPLNIEDFNKAVNLFKSYQKPDGLTALFWENNTYVVLDLGDEVTNRRNNLPYNEE